MFPLCLHLGAHFQVCGCLDSSLEDFGGKKGEILHWFGVTLSFTLPCPSPSTCYGHLLFRTFKELFFTLCPGGIVAFVERLECAFFILPGTSLSLCCF